MNKKNILTYGGILGGVILAIVFAVVLFNNSKEAISYKVTFETNGGTIINAQTIEENNKVVKPNNPTKEGYTFIEWTYGGKTYDFNSVITKDIVLTAKWQKVETQEETPSAKTYTVTFDSKGGSTVKSQTIEEGKTVTKPSNPTRSGYTFEGWTLNGSAYNFNAPVTKDIKLVAKWSVSPAAITLAEYNKIEKGMTYEHVKAIIGGECSKTTEKTINNITITGYVCLGIDGAATLAFQNNALESKVQVGLK